MMMKMLTKNYLLILFFLVAGTVAHAQTVADQDAYTKTITDRSAKIVAGIGITDSTSKKFIKVRDILVDHYRFTSAQDDSRKSQVKELKASGADKATIAAKTTSIDSLINLKLAKHHTEFLVALGKEITPEQIDGVKDAMTYKKVKFTYDNYLEELPQLTDVQKKQIKDWLLEAREKAIDAGSSDEKTAVFGKYKGRIANYLAKEGYDMKQAAIDWQKRRDAAKAAKQN